jgi:hypothetical protein
MTIEKRLWKDAEITEAEFNKITDELLVVNKKYGDKTTYNHFETCIRSFGYSIGKAKIIIGLCAARAMFANVIESWKNTPMEIRSILEEIDREDNKN